MREYFLLTKPGILVGNVLNALGGFFLASSSINPLLWQVLLGLLSVMASACIFNNYVDREIDAKMQRTQDRALAQGKVSSKKALFLGVILLIYGIAALYLSANFLTALCAFLGFFIYVGIYSFVKYYTSLATLIGSIAGAMPPLVGYFSQKAEIDGVSFLLFALVASWQMPHFLSIAIYRIEDYRRAKIPVIPLQKGFKKTKKQMLFYVILFCLFALFLSRAAFVGFLYKGVLVVLGGGWILLCLKGFFTSQDEKWARQMFRFSLMVILGLFLSFLGKFLLQN